MPSIARKPPSPANTTSRSSPTPPTDATTRKQSPWAVDKQERFLGQGSIYSSLGKASPFVKAASPPIKASPTIKHATTRPVSIVKPESTFDRDKFVRDLAEHIATGEAHLERMKAILQLIERPVLPAPPHEAISTPGDVLEEVLLLVPTTTLIGVAPQVCSAWRASACSALRDRLSPMQSPLAIRPLMAAIPTLRTLMRVSGVCKLWNTASRDECAEWRHSTEREIKQRADDPWSPLELSIVPFVDKVLRIAHRIGIEVVSSGGLVGVVRKAYRVLGLMPLLDSYDRASLELYWPELSMVARPNGNNALAIDDDDDTTFVVAALERIEPAVKALADALAVALLIVGSNDEEGEAAVEASRARATEAEEDREDDARSILELVTGEM